ncbi:MAG: extracellular solute-binding protein [bacterium]
MGSKGVRVGIAVSILVVLVACGLALSGTIEVWIENENMDRSQHRNWTWIYDEYERMTGEKLKVVFVPYDEALKKYIAAFAAGKAPDIIGIDRSWMPEFLKNDLLAPFPADLQKKWESLALPLTETLKIEGKVYGLPFGGDIYQLTYNKDMFREAGLDPNRPPETWDEFRSYAKKLTKSDPDGKITRVGYAIRYMGHPHGIVHKHLWAVWSSGAELIDPPYVLRGGKAAFNNEAGKASVELIIKMLYEDKSTAFGFPDPRDAFIERKAAMQISEGVSIATRAPKEAPDMDWGVALPPYRKVKATNFNTHPDLCVTSTSGKKDLAFKFLDYLMRPEILLYASLTADIHNLGFGTLSLAKDVYKHPFFAYNPYYKQTMEMSRYGRAYPINVHLSEVFEIFGSNVINAWQKKITVEEALAKAEKEINAVLAE